MLCSLRLDLRTLITTIQLPSDGMRKSDTAQETTPRRTIEQIDWNDFEARYLNLLPGIQNFFREASVFILL